MQAWNEATKRAVGGGDRDAHATSVDRGGRPNHKDILVHRTPFRGESVILYKITIRAQDIKYI